MSDKFLEQYLTVSPADPVYGFQAQEDAYFESQVQHLISNESLRHLYSADHMSEEEWRAKIENCVALILERNEYEGFQIPISNKPSNETLALGLVTNKGPRVSSRPIFAGLTTRFIRQLDDMSVFVAESDWMQGSDVPRLTNGSQQDNRTPSNQSAESSRPPTSTTGEDTDPANGLWEIT
eukprot:Blabericola_migrator_1__11444@NODE_67_length_15652_cov_76_134937_g60_i0_p7_GENE_NODE_67_length_15652_cov_76_134937_g60_i0NODE_67_length_15652_cov_76_134937_g60_i0_p7_ORF_typecomplete_len180_score22_37DCP1/PF06058_13/0_082Fmp27_WPPW/PF10359_9/0_078_NODE_67_length_15652_cov_76_134937_g60_i01003410573